MGDMSSVCFIEGHWWMKNMWKVNGRPIEVQTVFRTRETGRWFQMLIFGHNMSQSILRWWYHATIFWDGLELELSISKGFLPMHSMRKGGLYARRFNPWFIAIDPPSIQDFLMLYPNNIIYIYIDHIGILVLYQHMFAISMATWRVGWKPSLPWGWPPVSWPQPKVQLGPSRVQQSPMSFR